MKRILFLVIITLISFRAFPQKKKTRSSEQKELYSYTERWSEGSIMLTDRTEIKGLVRYEDRNGVLSYKNGDESRSFSPRSVMAFEFYDTDMGRQRVFYTLEFNDPKIGIANLYFFEVLREYRAFAVISKTNPIEAQVGGGMTTSGGVIPEFTLVSQTSTVYFLSSATGAITPYIQQIEGNKVSKVGGFNKDRNKLIAEKDVFAEFVGSEMFTRLEQYAKENDLSFSRKEDFLKVLQYYDRILSE